MQGVLESVGFPACYLAHVEISSDGPESRLLHFIWASIRWAYGRTPEMAVDLSSLGHVRVSGEYCRCHST